MTHSPSSSRDAVAVIAARWPGDRPHAEGDESVDALPLYRRIAKKLLRSAVDHGLPGTRRLDAHLVICGFPRSGSTVLQLVLDACVEDVCSFVGEVEASWAAVHANRWQRWLLTKRPADITAVRTIRGWYDRRPGRAMFLVTVRDPRDVLTSTHAGYPPSRGYYCEIDRWRDVHDRVRAIENDPDVVIVRYEDLTGSPAAVQQALSYRLNWSLRAPFERYHEQARSPEDLPAIDVGALGGLRPLEPAATGRWQDPVHSERLGRVVREAPEVAEACRHWGYSEDDSWMKEF